MIEGYKIILWNHDTLKKISYTYFINVGHIVGGNVHRVC